MFEGLFNSNHESGCKCNCTWIILILLFICFCGCGCGGKNKNWKLCINPCTLAPILALAFLCGGINFDHSHGC